MVDLWRYRCLCLYRGRKLSFLPKKLLPPLQIRRLWRKYVHVKSEQRVMRSWRGCKVHSDLCSSFTSGFVSIQTSHTKDHAHICLGLDLKSVDSISLFFSSFVFELIKLDACDLKSILFRTFCFVLLSEAYLVIALAWGYTNNHTFPKLENSPKCPF